MSATSRSDVRQKDDFYRTPDWAIEAILPHLRLHVGTRVWEPCAGDGAIVRILEAHGATVEALELDPDRVALCSCACGDMFEVDPTEPPDLIITNPPYRIAQRVVERCLMFSQRTVLLLPINFLASKERGDFLLAHPPDVYVLSPRPSFRETVWWHVMNGKQRLGKFNNEQEALEFANEFPFNVKVRRYVTNTDSNEYGWLIWGDGGHRWWRLEKP